MAVKASAPLAVRYVQIVPSFQGGAKAIDAQLNPAVRQAAKKAGEDLSRGIATSMRLEGAQKKMRQFGDTAIAAGKAVNSITRPAQIAAGAVAGLVTALGFRRLVGIDTARHQFQGLGFDANKVMEQVDRGVRDTSLSMAEGASMAVGMLATSVLPLEDVESQIKRVANVSAAYHVDAQQASVMLNSVIMEGSASWMLLRQMEMNNIPIVAQLGQQYGLTREEIMKMAQEGSISVEMLNDTLDHFAGEAAVHYADSFEGIVANVVANIGRLGAAMFEGVFETSKGELSGFLDWLRSDEATEAAAQMGQRISEAFDRVAAAIRGLVDWWQNLSPGMQEFIGKAALVALVLGPVLTIIGKISTGISALIGVVKVLFAVVMANPIVAIITVIVGALIWFFTQTELGQELWQKFVDFLKQAWDWLKENVFDIIETVLEGVIAAFKYVVESVIQVWGELKDAVSVAWEWLKEHVFAAIEGVLLFVIDWFRNMVEGVVFAWNVIKEAGKIAWEWIKTYVFEPIKQGLQWVTDKFEFARQVIAIAWQMIKDLLKAGWDWIDSRVFEPIKRGLGWVGDKFSDVKTFISNVWNGLKTLLKAGWDWISTRVFDPFKRGLTAVSTAFDEAKKVIDKSWSKIKEIAAKPVNFIIETVYRDGIKKFVETVADKLGFSVTLPSVSPIRLNRGGRLPGFGGGDRVPALLEPGEFVINKFAAAKNHRLLASLNGGYGVAPGTVGAQMRGAGKGCPFKLNKGGWLAGIGDFFGDVTKGIGAFIRDPLGAVAELITKPVEAMFGDVAKTVWGDLGIGAAKKVLSFIPDFFKKKSESIGNAGLVGAAMGALGVPYVWGGSSIPPGVDCSGLVYWAAQQLGLGWPRLTAAGYQSASVMKGLASAVPGDLLFWGNPAHHVAIYTGPGQMIHAPQPGTTVTLAGIYGSPGVGTYGGGGGAGLTSTYAGLVQSTAASSTSLFDFARNLRAAQYDEGGFLQPGYTLAFNGTGEPEPVFTARDWDAIRDGGTRVGTVNLNVDVSSLETLATVEEFADRLNLMLTHQGVR